MNLSSIIDALNFGNIRALFADARTPEKWSEIRTSPRSRAMLREITDQAQYYRIQPIKLLPYSYFKLFNETGSRQEYETGYFERRDRLNVFALAALIESKSEDLMALEDIIWTICDEYTWCLPAHLDKLTDSRVQVDQGKTDFKQISEEQTALDLFAAETAFAFAEILSLLGDKLSPSVATRARSEVFRRVLEPYQRLKKTLWWESTPMNWAAVCAGSIGAAAMYLMDEVSVLAPVLQRVLETMDCFLSGFGEDGVCTEGLGYWTYGFGFFTYFTALLKERTAGKLNLFQNHHVRQIALFQQKCYFTGNHVVPFSDSSLTQNYQTGLTHYLKRTYPEVEIPDPAYRAKLSDDSAHRWAHAVRDFVWDDDQSTLNQSFNPETTFFADAEWLISKAQINGNSVCFAVKGGHNDEPHNHNDIGSFILHVNGETFLAEMGRGFYTRQFFGPERYSFLCAGSQGHSVPVVDGQFQKTGPQYAARMLKVEIAAERDAMSLDIAPAYGIENLVALFRKFVFAKKDVIRLVLVDSYQLKEIPGRIAERLMTFIEPRILSDGAVRIKGVNGWVDIGFDPALLDPKISSELFTTHEKKELKVYIIDFDVLSRSEGFEVGFAFSYTKEERCETNP